MTTNTQREFWVRKDPEQEWQTLKVSHPDYTDTVRIVANTFKEQTFGGEVYLPAPMQMREPENAEDLKNTASVTLPRAAILRQKQIERGHEQQLDALAARIEALEAV